MNQIEQRRREKGKEQKSLSRLHSGESETPGEQKATNQICILLPLPGLHQAEQWGQHSSKYVICSPIKAQKSKVNDPALNNIEIP